MPEGQSDGCIRELSHWEIVKTVTNHYDAVSVFMQFALSSIFIKQFISLCSFNSLAKGYVAAIKHSVVNSSMQTKRN